MARGRELASFELARTRVHREQSIGGDGAGVLQRVGVKREGLGRDGVAVVVVLRSGWPGIVPQLHTTQKADGYIVRESCKMESDGGTGYLRRKADRSVDRQVVAVDGKGAAGGV